MSEAAARILVVDDEAPQMRALCDTLNDHGYEAVGFSSPKDAFATLHTSSFDLLLADLMMPEMSGIDLLKGAQELDPNLVSIIMTGQGTIATAVEAMKVGALDYILKPFKLSGILPVLSRALAVRRLRIENAELQRRVRERTAELEAANQELDSFAHSVSHDLRAPLRAVSGFSKILLEDSAPQMPTKAQSLLNTVIESVNHMGTLVEDLLRLSRFSRQPFSKSTVNVAVLASEVLDELRKQEADRDVEVCMGDLPECQADLALLRQVFTNLLSNAFKFTRGREHAVVEVGCRREKDENVYFVRDNGAGFDMRYADRLFGVFQRMHGTDEFPGTGVGLSIAHRIIQRHGGRIWADASVNTGATFFFTL